MFSSQEQSQEGACEGDGLISWTWHSCPRVDTCPASHRALIQLLSANDTSVKLENNAEDQLPAAHV